MRGLPQALTWGSWPCCPHPRSHKLVIQSAESRSQEGQRTSLWSKWGWVVIGSRTARNPLAGPAPFVLAGFLFSIEKKWVEGRVTGPTTSPETLILTKTKTANSIRSPTKIKQGKSLCLFLYWSSFCLHEGRKINTRYIVDAGTL